MKNYNASFLPSGGMTRHTLAFVQAFLLIYMSARRQNRTKFTAFFQTANRRWFF
jgi:hypothetical protein